jgi:hypothetical protein
MQGALPCGLRRGSYRHARRLQLLQGQGCKAQTCARTAASAVRRADKDADERAACQGRVPALSEFAAARAESAEGGSMCCIIEKLLQ